MQEDFLITNASFIDGTGSDPMRDWGIAIERDRIVWLGPSDSAPSFDPSRVIDAKGRTLLPGLINCHTHLCNDGAADFFGQVLTDSIPMATVRGVLNTRLTLDAGVTTVRDCGAANDVIVELGKAISRGVIDGPRIMAAGRVITMTGGHCYYFGREVDGPDEARKATRTEIKAGADFIKVMATGGVLTPGVDPKQTALQPGELVAVIEEAHNAGKRTACHAIGNAGIKNALEAGVDSIEHGFYLDDEAIGLAISNGAFLVPTLVAVNAIIDYGPEGGIADWVVEKARAESGHHLESFREAVKSGMKIAAGTDAGTPFNPHGDLSLELTAMVELGLTPMQAVVSATRNAAENLDVLHKLGTLEVGKIADLILVDGNPLEDIRALRQVDFVAKAGVIHRNEVHEPAITAA